MNPRKRKLVKSGEMQKIIDAEKKAAIEKTKNSTKETLKKESTVEEKENTKPMDSFIAKE